MLDCENAIALPAMQGNRASSHVEGEVSWVFSRYICDVIQLKQG